MPTTLKLNRRRRSRCGKAGCTCTVRDRRCLLFSVTWWERSCFCPIFNKLARNNKSSRPPRQKGGASAAIFCIQSCDWFTRSTLKCLSCRMLLRFETRTWTHLTACCRCPTVSRTWPSLPCPELELSTAMTRWQCVLNGQLTDLPAVPVSVLTAAVSCFCRPTLTKHDAKSIGVCHLSIHCLWQLGAGGERWLISW